MGLIVEKGARLVSLVAEEEDRIITRPKALASKQL